MEKITRRSILAATPAIALAPIAPALAEVDPLMRLRALHSEASELMEKFNEHMGDRWELRVRAPSDATPVVYKNLGGLGTQRDPASEIMILFREWEILYRQAGDAILEEQVAIGLLALCKDIETRMMKVPAASAADFAAKLIVATSYGDFILGGIGEEGLLDEALSLVDGGAA